MKTIPTKSESGLLSRPEHVRSQQELPAQQTTAWTGVFFDGPEPDQDHEGEEVPVWHVYVGTEDAEPVSPVYRVFSFTKAQALAQAISKDRRLELISILKGWDHSAQGWPARATLGGLDGEDQPCKG